MADFCAFNECLTKSNLASSSESLESGCEGDEAGPEMKGSIGWPILAMREISLALVASGF